jgi:UDPglucose 6-dehydrogenase
MKIAVIGTGYVGICTAISFAIWGHDVIGIDEDAQKVSALQSGKLPIYEPGIEENLQSLLKCKKISFTTNLQDAIKDSDIIYITVGTPSADDGSADLSQIQAVSTQIAAFINSYKVLVIKSTVPVGTGEQVKDLVSAEMRKRNEVIPFDVVSNPEFLREGQALHDTLFPERIIIGCESRQARIMMEKLYQETSCPVLFTSIRNAEMIKYASNTFLATKISFINELARMCDKTGTDIEEVAKGMGLDTRIGPHFLRAGIGYGGSCFPKDIQAFTYLGDQHGLPMQILRAVSNVNQTQVTWFFEKIESVMGELARKHIALLGLTFKPNTDDIRDAPALKIIEMLLQRGAFVAAYDPQGVEHVKRLYPTLRYTATPYEAIRDADAIILATEWTDILDIDWQKARSSMKGPYLFDGRNALEPQQMSSFGFYYIGVGRTGRNCR